MVRGVEAKSTAAVLDLLAASGPGVHVVRHVDASFATTWRS